MVKALIPGTAARQERMFRLGFQKLAQGHDVIVEVIYEDGEIRYVPAEYNSDIGAYETVNDMTIFVKGEGTQTRMWGVPVVHAYEKLGASISPEAAYLATNEEEGTYIPINEDGEPLDTDATERDDTGIGPDGHEHQVYDHVPATADGGEIEYDARGVSWRNAAKYAPFPVNAVEARQAVEEARLESEDPQDVQRAFLLGTGVGFGLIAAFIIILWILGQVGGGESGAVNIGLMLQPMLGF